MKDIHVIMIATERSTDQIVLKVGGNAQEENGRRSKGRKSRMQKQKKNTALEVLCKTLMVEALSIIV